MKSILAFGDSNTWGLVPGSKDAARYPRDVRWTGILQSRRRDVRVLEEGLCGRTTALDDEKKPGKNGLAALSDLLQGCPPLSAAILMLGTNDCKRAYRASADRIGRGIEACLDELEKVLPPERILLVSPILLGEDVWRPEKDPEFDRASVELCRELKAVYRRIAAERGAAFLAASDFVAADRADDEHMNAVGHRLFAEAVLEKLGGMGVL